MIFHTPLLFKSQTTSREEYNTLTTFYLKRKEAKITATSNQLLAKHILEFLLILKQSWAVC